MKYRNPFSVLVPLALIVGLTVAACAGVRARDALLPQMARMFVPIAEQAERGIVSVLPEAERAAPRLLIAEVREALDSGERARLLTLNPQPVLELARAGIAARVQAGELDMGPAASLLERLRQFERMWTKALER